ncbi:MAG: DegQ family serine endoprotease [Alphaproteobacteria bacterium]|nr:DegQ family serine endoprotease [Alphaproteobacteria bacterium]
MTLALSPSRPEQPVHRRKAGVAAAAALLSFAIVGSAFARPAPDGFADLVVKVKPAVVNISTTQKAEGPTVSRGIPQMPDLPEDSPFREFLERFFNNRGLPGAPGGSAPERKINALGSGFIIDPAGYVVTNNHVIEKATDIKVTLTDGTELKATLVGRDAKTDLALVKVEPSKPLPYLTWGDSDKAREGDWILAVGNPFGLGGSVTAGIISARGRDLASGPYDDYMQIDAPINRGNSGGPTFNMDGQVIGVNTAIFSPTGGSVGIGFAVPSNLAKSIVEDLRKTGRVERGWLGVQIQPVTPEIADSLGLKEPKGALVAGLTDDSPAGKAGIRQGDVIVGFNGSKIGELRDLTRAVAVVAKGTKVPVEVIRNGKSQTLPVTIAGMPREGELVAAAPADRNKEQTAKSGAETGLEQLGLRLAPASAETRAKFGLKDDVKGAVVVGVKPDAPAADRGINVGDVIVGVGQERVNSVNEVVAKVKRASDSKQKAVLLLIDRKGNERYIPVPLSQT